MFIQVIQGKTSDKAGLRGQFDRWQTELGPGAKGYLGSTGGVADDGTVIMLARFADEASARANSDRPDQGAWWNDTAKFFDGEPTFRDSTDVDSQLAGGSDEAGFVQVMQGRATERARLTDLEGKWMPQMTEQRPDVIGSTRSWFGDRFVEAIYFTSEAEARKGEESMTEASEEFAEYQTLIDDLTFIDLKDPWLHSA